MPQRGLELRGHGGVRHGLGPAGRHEDAAGGPPELLQLRAHRQHAAHARGVDLYEGRGAVLGDVHGGRHPRHGLARARPLEVAAVRVLRDQAFHDPLHCLPVPVEVRVRGDVAALAPEDHGLVRRVGRGREALEQLAAVHGEEDEAVLRPHERPGPVSRDDEQHDDGAEDLERVVHDLPAHGRRVVAGMLLRELRLLRPLHLGAAGRGVGRAEDAAVCSTWNLAASASGQAHGSLGVNGVR
mmetsp:Transcript_59517/g.191518  ORF Transcript_59517/g.191518 Transcript_59517/m.191518 type:complete len:241 (-) Transcript_59517:24-746(-)